LPSITGIAALPPARLLAPAGLLLPIVPGENPRDLLIAAARSLGLAMVRERTQL